MKYFRILFGLIQMARKPSDYSRVERFREVLRRYGYFSPGLKKVNELSESRALMKAQPLINWNALEFKNFKNFPPETLGYQMATFLEKAQLSPLDYSRDSLLSDEEFLIRRVVQTHDIWHVVLGYPTDELGEIGINSFMLAQIGWPPAGFYLGGYLLRQMLKAPENVAHVVQVIAEGWKRGNSTKPLFSVYWETQLHRPLAEIRNELGVTLNH